MRSTKFAPLSWSTSYFTGSASLGISMTTLISSGTLLPVGTWSRPVGVRFLRRGGAASGPAAGVGEGVGRGILRRGVLHCSISVPRARPSLDGSIPLRTHTVTYPPASPSMTVQLDSPQGNTAAQQYSVRSQPQTARPSLFNPAVEGPPEDATS